MKRLWQGAVVALLLAAVVGIFLVGMYPKVRADTAYISGTTLAMDQAPCLASSPSNPLPFVANGTTVTCGSFPDSGIFSGTTGSIGGGLLTAGSCATGTATVSGATTSMIAVANPTTYQGDGVQFQAYVSAANTVTVKACALLLITPTASTYKVRVVP